MLLPSRRELSPGIFFIWREMKELTLSIFADESGGQNGTSKYYLLTLVFHDQSFRVAPLIEAYKNSLNSKGLPDISLHASPLIYGKGEYENLDLATRKRLLASFFVLTRRLPVRYMTLAYKRAEVASLEQLIARIRRDLVVFISDNLEYFQSFDSIKIYYDNGQHAVTEALHAAIEFMLSKNAVIYKDARPQDYALSQVADFLCTVELTAIKYENHDETNTDLKVFGNVTEFKKGYLRHLRKKRLA